MPKKLTTEQFIEKAKIVHGDKYDYSKTIYINSRTKISYICKKHGIVKQIPSSHLNGFGCRKCTYNQNNTKKFIEKSKKIYKNKYDYSKTVYIDSDTKVCIICKDCGSEIYQLPYNHFRFACSGCVKKTKKTTSSFIKECKNKYGNRFDYNKVSYKNSNTKVEIFCNKCNKYFEQYPSHFLRDVTCPYCAIKNFSGENHPRWRHDLSLENRYDLRCYPEYTEWRKKVYERDNYTCQICFKRGGVSLNAHHLYSYYYFNELRTDIENGVTLCKECHKKFHHIYGYKKNTNDQFSEFKNIEKILHKEL